MKIIQNIGLVIFLTGLAVFCSLMFFGSYNLSQESFDELVSRKGIKSEVFIENIATNVIGKGYSDPFSFSTEITNALDESNAGYKANSEWDKVIWDKPHSLSFELIN